MGNMNRILNWVAEVARLIPGAKFKLDEEYGFSRVWVVAYGNERCFMVGDWKPSNVDDAMRMRGPMTGEDRPDQ